MSGLGVRVAKCSAACFSFNLHVCTVVPNIKNKRRGCNMCCSMVIQSCCFFWPLDGQHRELWICQWSQLSNASKSCMLLLHSFSFIHSFILDIEILTIFNLYCCRSLPLLMQMQYLDLNWFSINSSTLLVSSVHISIWNSRLKEDLKRTWNTNDSYSIKALPPKVL